MTAWQLAAQWQQEHCPEERLIEAVSKCIVGGVVHSSDELFVIGWEAHWNNEQKKITDGTPNAWVCKLAAGRNVLSGGMRIAPRKHDWIVWQRNNSGRWRARRWNHLLKHIK